MGVGVGEGHLYLTKCGEPATIFDSKSMSENLK